MHFLTASFCMNARNSDIINSLLMRYADDALFALLFQRNNKNATISRAFITTATFIDHDADS